MKRESGSGLRARFAIQVDSLQEGFELLSRAATVREMARRLFHLLRGTLTSVEAQIFLSERGGGWDKLHGKGTAGSELFGGLEPGPSFSAHSLDDPVLRVLAFQPLLDGSCLAVLLGRKLARRSPYTDHDRLALQIFLQLFANAYLSLQLRQKEKQLVFSLNHRLLQLNSLIDAGIGLTRLASAADLLRAALERAAALTNATRGVAAVTSGKKTLERHTFPEGQTPRRRLPEGRRIRTTFDFHDIRYSLELQEKESRAGIIAFEETDQLLLDALARQVNALLENRQLHALELERQKIERDIAVAGAIQQRILPETLPVIDGYDLAGVNIPTRLVGGDYYDCIPLADGRYALIMADVAGKGIPAALLVSSFHAYLSAYLENIVSLELLARRLNEVIYRASTEERYITAVLALFDPATGSVHSLNAGHTPMYLLRRDGELVELGNGGLALGMVDFELPYQTDEVTMGRGDRLFLFTDGVTEAMDGDGKLYDTDGSLRAFMTAQRPGTAAAFISALIDDIHRFSGAAPQADDITAMYLIRQE